MSSKDKYTLEEVDELTQQADALLVQLREVLDEMLAHLRSLTRAQGDK